MLGLHDFLVKDRVNWVLVVLLVALALLLAMSSAVGHEERHAPAFGPQPHTSSTSLEPLSGRDEWQQLKPPAELWGQARDLYRNGQFADASSAFEELVTAIPWDPAAKLWAGIAAYRTGDLPKAVTHWTNAWGYEARTREQGEWPSVALAAGLMTSGDAVAAARIIVPIERGDFGPELAENPVVTFYAAIVYEQLAIKATGYPDALEESVHERISPPLANSRMSTFVEPNSRSWLVFLARNALRRTLAKSVMTDPAAPLVPPDQTLHPELAPTVEDLLEVLGSVDFAAQANRKLRALEIYRSQPERRFEIFDDSKQRRGQFMA